MLIWECLCKFDAHGFQTCFYVRLVQNVLRYALKGKS